MSAVATFLGWPLLPWQRQVADVASEYRPGGGWVYPTVIVTVPRQSGKTTLLGAVMCHRAMVIPDHMGWYTAQTGIMARETWGKWQARPSVNSHRLAPS